MDNKELINQEFKYCLVGNIVQEREWGENHEKRKGTKMFKPGTKVYVSQCFCGDGGEKRYVIGFSRYKKYIKIIINTRYIENFRFQKVYNPTVLKLMDKKDCGTWYQNTSKDKEYIEDEVIRLNSADNPYLKKRHIL